jgi:hypothetical protein
MKKIISFSLYGNSPIYNVGCIENAKLKKEIFKDWTMRVYYNNSVPQETISELKNYDVELVEVNEATNYFGSLWRFRPINEEGVSRFISRDCDSRISFRDECSVNQWIESDKKFHIIRDHPIGHGWVMSAGMWGAKIDTSIDIKKLIDDYLLINNLPEEKSMDQRFLKDIIYPNAKEDVFVNDTFFNYEGIGVAISRDREIDDYLFIGEPFDEKNEYFEHYRNDIKRVFGYNC